MKFNPVSFIINLAIPLVIGAIGSYFTAHSVESWYPVLNKPSFNPPKWIFAPVWTILYLLIGTASYRVWQKRGEIEHFPRTIAIYLMQLVLNLMWSFIFFYARNTGIAFIEIIILLMVVIINASVFYKIDKTAGLLYVPYILWVGFATLLTYSIFSLN